jgi:HEAT repeat protein
VAMARHDDGRLRREFEQALAARSSSAYWRRVGQLQQQGTREVFDFAAELFRSRTARRRQLGADVLGELGYQQSVPPFKDDSASVLRALLKTERDASVLAAAITALARLRVRSAIPLLVPLAQHRSQEVRRALAAELPWCTWDSGEERLDPRVTAVLIDLSRDPVAVVRDWACFSLASSDTDSPKVRTALWDRVRDRHYDTRIEALRGLVRRRDRGVRGPLREAVRAIGSDRLGTWVMDDLMDYARRVRDRELVKALQS